MLILDFTVRLRIAYSAKRFPKYDDSINQTTILIISYCGYIYALLGSWIYSNQAVFENKVYPNKSHYIYNAVVDHDLDTTLTSLTPGYLYVLTCYILIIAITYLAVSALFFFCCPRFDFLPKISMSRYWKLRK